MTAAAAVPDLDAFCARYLAAWNDHDATAMADLGGKTALVTGANSGIGLQASARLAAMGAELVMVARNPTKGEPAVDEVTSKSGSRSVSLLLCDFA